MKKIVFIGGVSTGDALNGTGRTLKKLYESHGYAFEMIEHGNASDRERLQGMLNANQVDWVQSIAGVYADVTLATPDGKHANVWEALNIPYIALYGDSPGYFFDRHVHAGPIISATYSFPDHIALRKRLPHIRTAIGLLPPFCHDPEPLSSIDFKRKKDGKIYFFKNGNDPVKIQNDWRESLPESVSTMLLSVGEQLVANIDHVHGTAIDDAVQRYFLDRWIDIEALLRLRLFAIGQLDDYCRRVKSQMMAQALSDFPVVIQGYNWEHMDFSGKRCTFIAGGNYDATAPTIRDSLATFDMSPNTTGAPHERPVRAFGTYTLCLTNEQQFFTEAMPGVAPEFTFKFNHDSIQAKVADVLDRRDHYLEVGVEAARQFRDQYSGQNHIDFMMQLAETARVASGKHPVRLPAYHIWPPATV